MIETLQNPVFDQADANAAELASLLCEALKDNDEAIFAYDAKPEPIETEPRDGFWPWTSGGYHMCLPAMLSHHWGTGRVPASLQPMIDEGDRIIANEWARRFPDRPPLLDCIAAWEETDPLHKWHEAACEWECESWNEDTDCYFWKARVMFLAPGDMQNETGKPEVYIDAYLNTDLNYGRDHIPWLRAYGTNPDQTTGSFKRTIPLADFIAMDSAALEALCAEAIASLPQN